MFQLVVTAYDPVEGVIDGSVDTQTLSVANEQELVAFLDRFQQARRVDPDQVGRVLIKGPGTRVEVRSDAGALYLYDPNDPNRQGVPVTPQSFSTDGQPIPSAEDEDPRVRLSEKGKTAQMLKILIVAVIVTLMIQGTLFFSARDASPLGEDRVRPLPESAAQAMMADIAGFYVGGDERNPLAVRLTADGGFQFFERAGEDRWAPGETGRARPVRLNGERAVVLDNEQVMLVLSAEVMDLYGFTLERQPTLPEGESS